MDLTGYRRVLLGFAVGSAHGAGTISNGEASRPRLSLEAIPDFFKLPPTEHLVEPAGVAVNSHRAQKFRPIQR